MQSGQVQAGTSMFTGGRYSKNSGEKPIVISQIHLVFQNEIK